MSQDKQLLFADHMTLVHAAAAWNATNVIDLWNGKAAMEAGPLGTPPFDLARGRVPKLIAQITETYLAAAGASTVKVQLVNADTEDLATNPVVLADSGAIAKASLVAGYEFPGFNFMPEKAKQRYLGVVVTIATNPGTAGKLYCGFVIDKQQNGIAI
jgi:hypothetical protein